MKIVVLDKEGADSAFYKSWVGELKQKVIFPLNYDEAWVIPIGVTLIITAQHYQLPEYAILRRAKKLGIAVLILVDGILEYRNTWERKDIVRGVVYNPVVGHKLACMGAQQVRVIEEWGNYGKCENIGFPSISNTPRPKTSISKLQQIDELAIAICLSTTPFFSKVEKKTLFEKLNQLNEIIRRERANKLKIIWRMSPEQFSNIIKPVGILSNRDTESFPELLADIDIVLTLPSTMQIEAMYFKKPVVLLHYFNQPLYVNSAWFLSDNNNFFKVIDNVCCQDASKLFYQEQVLSDALRLDGNATNRMVELVEKMISYSENGKGDLRFPVKLIEYTRDFNKRDSLDLYSLKVDVREVDIENMLLKKALIDLSKRRLKEFLICIIKFLVRRK